MLEPLDLYPLTDQEIDWIVISAQEFNRVIYGDFYHEHPEGDQKFLCGQIAPLTITQAFRYCTRAKCHKGPHVSGVTEKDIIISWPQEC